MGETAKRVMVTGARGLLGAEVIGRLVAQGHSVIALVRSNGAIVRNGGSRVEANHYSGSYPAAGSVSRVQGDVADDRLGLELSTYRALQADSDAVIHCAALTSFGRKP